jgi:integrase
MGLVSGRIRAQGQLVGEHGGSMARRRYQRGQLFLRGKKIRVWVGRWREDELTPDGAARRVFRSEVLGTLAAYPTKSLAKRALADRLATVNDPRYRARPTATFAEFAPRWEAKVATQFKPSTQAAIRSHLRLHLVPFFGKRCMKDIQPELVQGFISQSKASPKTRRNLVMTLRMMWKSARAWGYVLHDPFDGLVLPKARKARSVFFTLEEVQRILAEAQEPSRMLYWLAAETGMRAGELCGLTVDDLDFGRQLLHVRQSAWHGKLQTPKTENSLRTFALSAELAEHLKGFLLQWRPNPARLLFSTRNGTPWDGNMLVKRKLHPLLDRLGIQRCGLHAFRHANETLMDRLGAPLKVRQERLGHSDPRLTLGVYTHVASGDDSRVASELGRLLSARILHPLAPKSESGGLVVMRQPALIQ